MRIHYRYFLSLTFSLLGTSFLLIILGYQGLDLYLSIYIIEYFYKGNQNNFLNKIGSCYLTDCDVTYGGDRYTAFTQSTTKDGESGASPTEIHMQLNFQEMDIITHDDVAEGF